MSHRKFQTKCGVKDKSWTKGIHRKEEKQIASSYRTFCEKHGMKMGFNQYRSKPKAWMVDEEF